MTWLVDRVEGFDHGVASTAGSGLANTITNAALVAGAAQTGGFGCRLSPTGAAIGHWEWPVTGASNRQVCFKGTLKIPTLPASDLVVAQPYYAGSGIRTRLKVTSGGNLKVESHAGTASQLSTNTYTASTVVKVEVRVFNNNSTGVRTVRWRLDNVDQTTLTTDDSNTVALQYVRLGTDSTTGPAADIDWDDCVFWVSTSTTEEASWPTTCDYRLVCRQHLLTGDGTHSVIGTYSDSGGTGITGATTNAWSFIDDQSASSTDFVRKTAGTTSIATDYLEFVGQTKSASGAASGDIPYCVSGYLAAAESANQGEVCSVEMRVVPATRTTTLFNTDIGSQTVVFKHAADSSDTVFSSADMDNLRFRYGSTDPSPEPRLHCLWGQVAYLPVSAWVPRYGFVHHNDPGIV